MKNMNFPDLWKVLIKNKIRKVKLLDTVHLNDKIIDASRFNQFINSVLDAKLQNGEILESQLATMK